MTTIEDQIAKRIGKIGKIKDYSKIAAEEERKKNEDKVLLIKEKNENGITVIDLILEPDKFNKLNIQTRLTFNEFCDALNEALEEEESEWNTLRMRDQIQMTRDKIIEATMIKYASEQGWIDPNRINGKSINYSPNYDMEGNYIGDSIIVSLTMLTGLSINKG